MPLELDDRALARSLVETYLRAWRLQEVDLLDEVFTDDAVYRERAYSNRYVGRDQIRSYWITKVIAAQANIECTLLHVYLDGNVAIAEWEATFDDLVRNERKRMTEVAIMSIEAGRIVSFREYWSSIRVGSLHNASGVEN